VRRGEFRRIPDLGLQNERVCAFCCDSTNLFMLLQNDFGEQTNNELQLMFRDGQINLSPGFQRKSVWRITDRCRLIQSWAIVLYRPSFVQARTQGTHLRRH